MLKLIRRGNLYLVSPWISSLEPVLTYTRFEQSFGNNRINKDEDEDTDRKKSCEMIKEPLWQKVDNNTGVFSAGMLSRVKSFFKKNNIEHSIVDPRDLKAIMPIPDFSQVDKLRENQAPVLVNVASNDRGIIICNTGFGKSFLIKQICKMYPTLKIIVTSPGRDDVRNLYFSIKQDLNPGAVGLIGGGRNDGPHHRITVVTNKSLLKADLANCDLFLCDEVHSVGYNNVASSLKWVQKARMFGFTATPKGRSDNADMIMEALFGKPIAEFDYEESVSKGTATPIEVWVLDTEGEDVDVQSIVSKKRHMLWRNKHRNKKIAEIAKTFPEEEQVLIMVETFEHLMYLKKLLPDFTAVYANKDPKEYEIYQLKGFTEDTRLTTKARNKLYEDFKSGSLKKVIATGIWKQGVDFVNLSVLIRADGASSPILSVQIPGRLSRISNNKTKGILVDFSDRFSSWSRRRADKRLKTYRSKGWTIVPR